METTTSSGAREHKRKHMGCAATLSYIQSQKCLQGVLLLPEARFVNVCIHCSSMSESGYQETTTRSDEAHGGERYTGQPQDVVPKRGYVERVIATHTQISRVFFRKCPKLLLLGKHLAVLPGVPRAPLPRRPLRTLRNPWDLLPQRCRCCCSCRYRHHRHHIHHHRLPTRCLRRRHLTREHHPQPAHTRPRTREIQMHSARTSERKHHCKPYTKS